MYVAPVLIMAPFFSWTLEAGQLSRTDSNHGSIRQQQDIRVIQRLEISQQPSSLVSAQHEELKPAAITLTPEERWLADFHRANEFISAQNSNRITQSKPHNPNDWVFERSIPLDISRLPDVAPDTLLPELNPIARLSFFAPLTDDTHRTIMLDPGHGGSDPGTVGANGLLEKHLTLDIAQRVQHLLAEHPHIDVVLTRQDDKGYSRTVRMLKVQATQPDILLSLHFNNLPQKNLTLVESFYAARNNIRESESGRSSRISLAARHSRDAGYPFVNESRRLADLLQSHLFNQVSQDNPSAINAGTKADTLFMLTRSYLPATLIELTCLSNSSEERRLMTSKYRQEIAVALAKGILEYFATQDNSIES